MRRWLLGMGVLLVLLIAGCATAPTAQVDDDFTVLYFARITTNDVVSVLDINYQVQDGIVTKCEGLYILQTPQGGEATECDINKLIKKEYLVPIKLITEISQENLTGHVVDGPGEIRWKIMP